MGRRSTKTTKTGKFMNPTDQWRKQQRRRELKKNRKQRKVVREAVLRMKDVGQMLDEIEEIEKLQMTSLGSDPMPNEKGLEEKKAKLHASVHRVAAYYQGEDPKKAQEIRLLIMESEKKRREMSAVYNSYRAARSEYSIDQIPLPDSGEGGGVLPSDIPMPEEMSTRESGLPPGLVPPGPPPGPPPSDLPEYNVIELEKKSVRFATLTGPQDDSEGESGDEEQSGDDSDSDSEEEDSQPAPPGPPPGLPPSLLAPPPLRAPPPPPLLAQSFPPRVGLPPGPPPGPPPARFSGPKPLMPPSTPHIQSSAVLSAPPTRSHAPPPSQEDKSSADSSRAAVISAQPQLRNMTAEVTKFMPTSLRVRRNHPKPTKLKPTAPAPAPAPSAPSRQPWTNRAPPTQGDAYDAFMREMQGLL